MRQHVSACVSTGQHGSAWRALPCRSRLSRTIAAARIDRGAPLTPYYYQRLRVNGLVVVVWSHKHGMGCAQVTYAIVRCTAHMLCFPPDWVYVHGARVPLKAMVWYGARASHSRPWHGARCTCFPIEATGVTATRSAPCCHQCNHQCYHDHLRPRQAPAHHHCLHHHYHNHWCYRTDHYSHANATTGATTTTTATDTALTYPNEHRHPL